jgi:hypothetical protein
MMAPSPGLYEKTYIPKALVAREPKTTPSALSIRYGTKKEGFVCEHTAIQCQDMVQYPIMGI